MLNITKSISKFNFSSGNDIKYIVIHDTGNNTDSAEANANYFGSADRQASAHYFVDNDSIVQVVEDVNSAWHCGDGAGKYGITNRNSLGVEMCRVNNDITPETESNTVDLVKYLMKKYNVSINNVVRHYDASRKNCPAAFSNNNWERWTAFKTKLVLDESINVSAWAKEGYKFVTENKISDGKRPKDNVTREEMWTMLHNFYKMKT